MALVLAIGEESALSSLELKLAVDHVRDVVRSQLNSNALPAVVAMRKQLTASEFEALARDIAANVVQSLL